MTLLVNITSKIRTINVGETNVIFVGLFVFVGVVVIILNN